MRIYNTTIKSCLLKIAYRNKYDTLSNEIVKEIFQAIIINKEFFVIVERENITIRVRAGKNGAIDGKGTDKTDYNFTISAHAGLPQDETIDISINLDFKNGFSANDYSSFNFSLYEAVRHEIEHAHQFSIGKYPDETYKKKQDDMFSNKINDMQSLRKYIQSVSDYMSSNEEIESYARSIIYVAKKQNKSPNDVILQICNRAFFNNKSDIAKIVMSEPSLSKIIEETKVKITAKIKELHPRFNGKTVFV